MDKIPDRFREAKKNIELEFQKIQREVEEKLKASWDAAYRKLTQNESL